MTPINPHSSPQHILSHIKTLSSLFPDSFTKVLTNYNQFPQHWLSFFNKPIETLKKLNLPANTASKKFKDFIELPSADFINEIELLCLIKGIRPELFEYVAKGIIMSVRHPVFGTISKQNLETFARVENNGKPNVLFFDDWTINPTEMVKKKFFYINLLHKFFI